MAKKVIDLSAFDKPSSESKKTIDLSSFDAPLKKKVPTSEPISRASQIQEPKSSLEALGSGLENSQAAKGANVGLDLGQPSTETVSPITAPLKATKEQTVKLSGTENIEKGINTITSTGIPLGNTAVQTPLDEQGNPIQSFSSDANKLYTTPSLKKTSDGTDYFSGLKNLIEKDKVNVPDLPNQVTGTGNLSQIPTEVSTLKQDVFSAETKMNQTEQKRKALVDSDIDKLSEDLGLDKSQKEMLLKRRGELTKQSGHIALVDKETNDINNVEQFVEDAYSINTKKKQASEMGVTMEDFNYLEKKNKSEKILSFLPDDMKEQNEKLFGVTSNIRDLLTQYDIKTNPETGELDLSSIKDGRTRQYLEEKIGGYNKEYEKLMSSSYNVMNDKILQNKNQIKEFEMLIKKAELLKGSAENYEQLKLINKRISDGKVSLENLKDETYKMQKSKNSFFNVDPNDIKAEFKSSASAKSVFSALPDDMSAKDKFDLGFSRLVDINEELAKKLGIDNEASESLGTGLRDWIDLDGIYDLSPQEKEYYSNKKIIQAMTPIYLNNTTGLTKRSGGLYENFMDGLEQWIKPNSQLTFNETNIAKEQLNQIQKQGFSAKDLTSEQSIKELEKRIDVPLFSMETAGQMLGTTGAIMAEVILSGGITAPLKSTKTVKSLSVAYDKAMDASKVLKFIKPAVTQGIQMEIAGDIFTSAEDELNFLSGAVGALGGEMVSVMAKKLGSETLSKYVSSIFGSNSNKALYALKRAGEINNRGIGEVAEEATQELVGIYNDELREKGFWDEVGSRYGTLSDIGKLVVSSYIMGSAFGMNTKSSAKEWYDSLPTEEKTIVDKIEKDTNEDVKSGVEAVAQKTAEIKDKTEGVGQTEVVAETAPPIQLKEETKTTETPKVSAEKPSETTTDKTSTPKTDITDTNVGEIVKPEIKQEEGQESSYTDKEGKFFSEKEVLNMDSKQLSEMNIQNPSKTVSSHLETLFPTKKEDIPSKENISTKDDEIKSEMSINVDKKAEIPEENKLTVYHGGILDIESGEINGELYTSPDKKQAEEYAKSNDGHITTYEIDKSKVATEDEIRDSIKELNLESSNGDSIDELNIYELIDSRFEGTAFSDSDKEKLFKHLSDKGFESAMFTDEDVTGKSRLGIDNIVVFDKQHLNEKLIESNEYNAKKLFEKGYRPLIDGEVKTDYTEKELEDYFYENESVEMVKPTITETKQEVPPSEPTNPATENITPPEEKISSQSKRAMDAQGDKDLADRIEKISKYTVQNQEQFYTENEKIIDEIGVDKAIEYAKNITSIDKLHVRKAILEISAGKMGTLAMSKIQKGIETNDNSLLEEGQVELERAMVINNDASQIGTQAGQINAFTNKVYEKFPSFYALSNKDKLTKQFGATDEQKEEINELQNNISQQTNNIVEEMFTDALVEELQAKVEELEKKLKEKGGTSKVQQQKEKSKKAKTKFDDALAKFKNAKKSGETSASFIGLNNSQIEAIGEMISAVLEMGFTNSKLIVAKVYESVKDADVSIRKDHIKTIAREISEFESLYNSEIDKKNQKKQEKAEKGELPAKELREILKQHLTGKNPNYRSLAEKIAEKSGKTEEESKLLADTVEASIKTKIEEMVKVEYQKFIDKSNQDKNKTVKELKNKRQQGIATDEELELLSKKLEDSQSKEEVSEIMKLLMMGQLSNSRDFTNAFEKRFGFKQLSSTTQKQVDALAFEIFDLQSQIETQITTKSGASKFLNIKQRQRMGIAQKRLNTLLESNKPWNTARILKEIQSAIYVNMLSGAMTFVRAGIGGYVEGAIGTTIYTINPWNYKHLGKGLIAAWESLPAAYNRAIQSRKSGYDMFGESSMREGVSRKSMGAYERTMLSGLGEAYYNKKYKQTLLKSVGQILKNIHALGALDTFMNTVAGNYVGTIEAAKAKEYEKFMNADLNEIASSEWKTYSDSIEKTVKAKNPNISAEKIYDEVNKIIKQELGLTGSRLKAKKVFITNRVQELKENSLGKFFDIGVNLAKDASMMGQPDGVGGLVAKGLDYISAIKDDDHATVAILKFLGGSIFKFNRIGGQLINKSLNNIPLLGIANAAFGPGYNYETNELEWKGEGISLNQRYKANPLLFKQRMAQNLVISALTLAMFLSMFDDDDKEGLGLDENRPFDIRGFGDRSQGGKDKMQRKYEGYQNLSISFTKKDGKWVNYVQLKLSPSLAGTAVTLGYFSDILKGDVALSSDADVQKDKLEKFKKNGLTVNSLLSSLLQGSSLITESSFSSVASIKRNFDQGETVLEGLGFVGRGFVMENAKPLIEPRVFESVITTLGEINKTKEKELRGWKYFGKNLYGLDGLNGDNKTDVFGNEYIKENDYEKFLKETFGSGEKRSEKIKEIELLYKFEQGANISKQRFNELKSDSKTGFVISGRTPYGRYSNKYISNDDNLPIEAQNIQETKFKELVKGSYEYLNGLKTQQELEDKLKNLQEKSVKYAKKEIVKKYKGTDKIIKVGE